MKDLKRYLKSSAGMPSIEEKGFFSMTLVEGFWFKQFLKALSSFHREISLCFEDVSYIRERDKKEIVKTMTILFIDPDKHRIVEVVIEFSQDELKEYDIKGEGVVSFNVNDIHDLITIPKKGVSGLKLEIDGTKTPNALLIERELRSGEKNVRVKRKGIFELEEEEEEEEEESFENLKNILKNLKAISYPTKMSIPLKDMEKLLKPLEAHYVGEDRYVTLRSSEGHFEFIDYYHGYKHSSSIEVFDYWTDDASATYKEAYLLDIKLFFPLIELLEYEDRITVSLKDDHPLRLSFIIQLEEGLFGNVFIFIAPFGEEG